MLINMPLEIFTNEKDFPLHLQYGMHYDDDCYVHGHADFSELVVVLDGSAVHIAGDESYPISKGDVFVVSQYTAHGFAEAKELRICNIMFKPEVIFGNIYDLRRTAGFQALFVVEPQQLKSGRFESRLKLSAQDFICTEEYINDMMSEYTERPDGWQTAVYAAFLKLCTRLSRCYEKSSEMSAGGAMKLAKASAFIEKNYIRNISMNELSKAAGYSERQLTRLFRETFSVTTVGYITRLRMQKAQELLRLTDDTIGEIAWQCGYEDQNYFTRSFRKYTGLSPTEWRRRR